MPRQPGEWQTFDITLVGRTVTVMQMVKPSSTTRKSRVSRAVRSTVTKNCLDPSTFKEVKTDA